MTGFYRVHFFPLHVGTPFAEEAGFGFFYSVCLSFCTVWRCNISTLCYSHVVQLVLTSSRGGVWRYPLKFTATEADPDDVIELEAVGLHKNVSIGFRLTSQSE